MRIEGPFLLIHPWHPQDAVDLEECVEQEVSRGGMSHPHMFMKHRAEQAEENDTLEDSKDGVNYAAFLHASS